MSRYFKANVVQINYRDIEKALLCKEALRRTPKLAAEGAFLYDYPEMTAKFQEVTKKCPFFMKSFFKNTKRCDHRYNHEYTFELHHSSYLDPGPIETGDTFYAGLAITVQSEENEMEQNFELRNPIIPDLNHLAACHEFLRSIN